MQTTAAEFHNDEVDVGVTNLQDMLTSYASALFDWTNGNCKFFMY
jgi:hypothetical protein